MQTFLESPYALFQLDLISKELFAENFNPPNSKELSSYLLNLLQFQKKLKFRIPSKLFWNLSPKGPIFHILRTSLFNLGARFNAQIWFSKEFEPQMLNMITLILNDQETQGFWKRPLIFIAPSVSFSDKDRYQAIIEKLGGAVNSKFLNSSHVINHGVPYENKSKKVIVQNFDEGYCQLHSVFEPTFMDLYTKENNFDLEDDEQPDVWFVDFRWLLDSEKHFEWINENDYQVSDKITINSETDESSEEVSDAVEVSDHTDDYNPGSDLEEEVDEESLDQEVEASDQESEVPLESIQELEEDAMSPETEKLTLPSGNESTVKVINLDRRLPLKLKRHEYEPMWDGKLLLLDAQKETIDLDGLLETLEENRMDIPPFSDFEVVALQMLEENHGPIALEDYELIRKRCFELSHENENFEPTLENLRRISIESDLHMLYSIYEIINRKQIYNLLIKHKKKETVVQKDVYESIDGNRKVLNTLQCWECFTTVIGPQYRLVDSLQHLLCVQCFKTGRLPMGKSSSDFEFRQGVNFNEDGKYQPWVIDQILTLKDVMENGSIKDIALKLGKSESECMTEFLGLKLQDINGTKDVLKQILGNPKNPVMALIVILAVSVHPGLAAKVAQTSISYLIEKPEHQFEKILWDCAYAGWNVCLEIAKRLATQEEEKVEQSVVNLNKLMAKRIALKLDLLEGFNNGPQNLNGEIVKRLLSNTH